MSLYKGKYLVALYDQKDECVCVGSSLDELSLGKNYIYWLVHQAKLGKNTHYKLHLIDCTEKHNDIFAEEDDIFMQEMGL